MKRWEEQQRLKQYANRISQAKPTLTTQPKKTRQSTASLQSNGGRMVSLNSAGTMFSSSEDMMYQHQQQPNEVPLFLSDITSAQAVADNLYLLQSPNHANIQMQHHTPMSAGNNFHQHHLLMSTNSNNITESTSSSKSRQEQPIFQLLKAFKLQQYAGKLTEVGYGQDIYKLALLNEQQRQDLITQLKVLPGHKAKLLSLFDVIDELYPKKKIMEQLKHYSTPPQQNPFTVATSKHSQRQTGVQFKRAQTTGNQGLRPQRASGTSYGQRGQQQRSLMKEYEALDPLTKQAFNNTFLINMESVKYSIPQLFQQHFNNEDHINAINQIFPPSYYYGAAQQQPQLQPLQEPVSWGPTYGYDPEEVQLLVTKYVGRAATLTNNSQQPTIATSATQNRRQSKERSTSSNRQKEEELHLKQEMAQALKVIERVNKEIEHITKASQKEYENIKEQNSKQYGRQMTGGSTKNNSITQDSQASSNYLKRKPTTASSVQQSKPSSVHSTKRLNTAQQSTLLQKQNTVQPKPVLTSQQHPLTHNQKPNTISHEDPTKPLGRFQSNRALARERERQHMIQPQRVITEHEIASETTTPQTSKLAVRSQKESSSDKRSTQMPLFNSSALSKQEQQDPANVSSVKKNDQEIGVEDESGSRGIQFETAERKQLVNKMEVEEECEEVKITLSTKAKGEEVKTLQTQPIEEEPSQVETDVIKPFVLEDDESPDKVAIETHEQEESMKEMNDDIGPPQIQQNARPPRKLSPLLEKEERELLWNNALGHSLDSKQVVSALGYLDLKQICLCLAHALNRHIQFSQGFYFLDDLQEQIKQLHLEEHFKLDFSYELDPRFKIDIDAAKQKQKNKTAEQQEQSRREFEELKQKMTEQQQQLGGNKVFDYAPQARKQISPTDLAGCEDTFERDENEQIEYGLEDRDDQSDEDSAGEERDNEQYIQDFYGNHSGATTDVKNKGNKPAELIQIKSNQQCATVTHTDGDQMKEDEAIDLDYSYSHLEDFLRSQRHHGSMISGPQITSINSALIVDSHKKSHAANGPNATSTTTQQLMNTFLTSYNKNKGGISSRTNNQQLQEVIKEAEQKGDESGSHETPPINNNSIIKPLFQLQPVQQIPTTEEKKEVNRSKINALAVLGMGSENSFTSSMADSLKIDVRTKEGFKDLIRFQMRIFDYNYDFESDTVVEEIVSDEFPTLEELYYYCKYVILSGRMEKEIPILCLVYLERFLTKTGILLNHLNWRRLTLISLCLASKIWDDDSLENVHFPKVMPDITLKEIASLEKVFLQFLDFDLLLRGAEYAKYYFILKTFAGEQSFNSCLPPVGPLTTQKMSELQNNTAKVESELRDKYHVKISLQKTM